MGSRRAAPLSRSHARRKGGARVRTTALALGAVGVTAGVGFLVLASGGADTPSDHVAASTAHESADLGGGGTDASSPVDTPSPAPSASESATEPEESPEASPEEEEEEATEASAVPASKNPAPEKEAAPDGSGSSRAGSGSGSEAGNGSGSGQASTGGSGGSSSSGSTTADDGGSGVDTPATDTSDGGPEAQVLALVNQERASAGCSPVTANAQLTRAADDYSDVMAASGVMSHTGPDGSTMAERVEAAGYQWSTVGENIARGQADAAAVMDSWMNSPGHRANILNCSFKELGVGVHFGDGGPWWTQNFGTSR
ncbi:CAP domain-containing protein [Streptomyces sp. WMMC905]|uniref:CAP domain-containing protein n=1 Tax=Streptomyces sp. WMMC905 TaxID=3404123 RepID=UPI003B94392E